MELAWNVYSTKLPTAYNGFKMTKFRYNTISRRPEERSQPKDDPRSTKNKSEMKFKLPVEEEVKLKFHWKNCEYDVIKNVITQDFGFALTEDDKDDFDIIWHNTGMKVSQIKRLKCYQKYNHFPGMYQLANKRNLGRNLMKMHKLYPEEYNFFPKTWVLPNDFPEFIKHSSKQEGQYYIVKPDMSSQGRGIYLAKGKEDINPKWNAVIQEYLQNPFLVDNLKFDIRLYVLVTSVDPLRIYLFNDGLVRFATVEYSTPTEQNMANTYIHLTNYAINKNNENFKFNEGDWDKGHKRTLSSFWRSLKESGIQTDVIDEEIRDLIVKTFLSVQPQLAHQFKSCLIEDIDGSSCFEILGFDIMLDENLDWYLIEVNHAPSFATDSNLDLGIKQRLIKDTFTLLNMSVSKKIRYKKERNKVAQNRILTGRKEIISQEDKELTRRLNNYTKHKFEMSNLGHFKLLFPLLDEKNNVVGDENNDYYGTKKTNNLTPDLQQNSEKSTSDDSKGNNDIVVPILQKTPKKMSEKEKQALKYNGFIRDAFDEWDEFNNGFRFRTRFSAPEDDTVKKSANELNSRNPNNSKSQFQKTVRMSKKTGFGSSASRLDYPVKRIPKNVDTPKRPMQTSGSDILKGKRVIYAKHPQPSNMMMSSVLSKYISKSIVMSKERHPWNPDETNGQPIFNSGWPKEGLPVITNPKTLKEIQVRNNDARLQGERVPQSNKNSTPKLPKVL